MNNKLLIVGSFPDDRSNIFGGIAKSCKVLINSKFFNEFEIQRLDSSQLSYPKPSLFFRSINAMSRIIKLTYVNFTQKSDVVLIFCSDGLSAIEKGIMIIISKFQGSKVMIFPRAGNLIVQTKKNRIFNYLIKILFNKSDIFLAQGKNWKKFAKDLLNIDVDKIEIIHNWTATNELLEIGHNREFMHKQNIKLLYIGWIEKEKGLIELINAIKILVQKGYSLELVLIGDGSMREEIESYTRENKIDKKVFLKGWLSSNAIKFYLKVSDIFILPSWQEGMPNSLIEAVSSGIPSVASSVGVIPNYFTHLENIMLTEPKNITNLHMSIEELIKDFNLRKKLSNNALIIAKNFFSEDKSLENLSNKIKQI